MELPEAADLKARHERALAWATEARDHLANEEVPTEEHAPILEVGISSLESLPPCVPLHPKHIAYVWFAPIYCPVKCVSALDWGRRSWRFWSGMCSGGLH